MADKQAVFTLKVNTGNSVQDVQNFDQSVNKLNKDMQDTQKTAQQGAGTDTFSKKLDELDKKLSSGTLTFKEMTKLMKEYQTIAAQAGTQTPVGDRAIRSAAGLKDTLTDLQVRTKLLSSDYIKLDTALAGVQTGAAAFQGVTSAVALTGVESEALVKTMVKLQAAQGLVNAVSTVTNALNKDAILGIQARIAIEKVQAVVIGQTTGAMKLLRIAMASTGIGILIAGIGLLVSNFDKVWNVIKQGIDIALAPLKSALDVVVESYYAVTDALGITSQEEREREKQAKQIASEEQKRAAERKRQHQELKKQIDESVGKIERLQYARKQAYDDEIALLEASGKQTAKIERQKLKDIVETQKEILKERMKQEDFFAELYAKSQVEQAEFQLKLFDAKIGKELADKQKEQANKRRDLIRQIQDEEIKAIEDQNQREQTQLIVSANRRIDDVKRSEGDAKLKAKLIKEIEQNLIKDLDKLDQDYYNQQQEAQKKADGFRIQRERELSKILEDLSEENFLRTLSDQDKELLAIQDKYFELETLAQGNADALREIEIAKLNALNDVNVKYQDERDRKNEEQRQKDLKREQDILEFKLYAATETFKLISDVTDLFAKKGEKSARRAFMIQKASSIAQATIETYKGANAIFASAAANPQSILFPAQPFIAAGLAISAGIANVAKIASQKFEGGSQSASGGGAEVPSNLTGASASSFTANTNAQTTDLTTLGQGAQPNVQLSQVVVLESDITGTQNKVKLQEAKTSF